MLGIALKKQFGWKADLRNPGFEVGAGPGLHHGHYRQQLLRWWSWWCSLWFPALGLRALPPLHSTAEECRGFAN